MRSAAELDAIHRFRKRHRALMERSERAGCFQCGLIFAPSAIREWLDEPPAPDGSAPAEATATCPRCGFDAVLPSAAVPIDATLLDEMARRHYGPG